MNLIFTITIRAGNIIGKHDHFLEYKILHSPNVKLLGMEDFK